MTLGDVFRRLFGGKRPKYQGVFFVDVNRVNIDDVIDMADGYIVRCHGDPRDCVAYFSFSEKPDGQA